jgi:hypothetical protein
MKHVLSAVAVVVTLRFAAGCVPGASDIDISGGAGGAIGTGGQTSGTGGTPTSGTGGGTATGGRTGTGGAFSGAGGKHACGPGGYTGTTDPSDPLNKVVTCTSGRMWTNGNGETMRPGDRCQGCHLWNISGTVYPTGHEQAFCNGLNGSTGVTVTVTDSAGRNIVLTPNSVGNFFYAGAVTYPYTAKVTRGTSVRAMSSWQCDQGDCNACHTQEGIQGAPGRIVPPL